MTKFTMWKNDKNNLQLYLKNGGKKPYAYFHTMKKTYAKLQNNRHKTVRGVSLTRGTHCLYIEGEK